jgi:[acyl-carrier-protein] S-malonyltransferase
MGKRLTEVSRAARDVFRRADEVLERHLSRLCFEGPEEELEQTVNQQPATFVVSLAWLAALHERWEMIDEKLETFLFAGHSMGEYTAAVASGTISFEDGLRLVQERGYAMEEAGERNPGGMASILGLSDERVTEICAQARPLGVIGLSNSNCDGQVVISGEIAALERAMELAKAAGARRAIRLPITIASHCSLMQPAQDRMNRALRDVTLIDPHAPLVGNITAEFLDTGEDVRQELEGQLIAGVQWKRAVEQMVAAGADTFIEIGHGSVLTRILRRIDPNVTSLSISDPNEGLLSERFASVEAARQ